MGGLFPDPSGRIRLRGTIEEMENTSLHDEPAQMPDLRGVLARWPKHYLAQIAAVAVAYVVAGRLGQATSAIRSSNLGPVWPAYGVALAGMILFGYRIWPAVAASAFVVALLGSVGVATALGQATAATLAAGTGAFLLHRLARFDPAMPRLRDALWLVTLGAFGSALISASLGSWMLCAAHIMPYSGIASGWLIYWLGDSTGALLVTPLLLTLPRLFRRRDHGGAWELGLLLVLVTATSLIVFSRVVAPSLSLDFLAFAVQPLVMWSAIRMGTAVTSLVTLLIASIATVETALGLGPLAGNGPFVEALLLDIFFAVVGITGLALAGVIAERKEAERARLQLERGQAAAEARLRLASIIESSDDAIIGANPDGTISDWNKGAELLFGYAEAEVIATSLPLLLGEPAPKELSDILRDLSCIANVNRYDCLCKRKDGTNFEAEVRVSPILDTAGRNRGGSVNVRDITFRKREEALLRESESRFRLVADTAPVMIWMSGTDKLCTYFNQPWLDFTGKAFESQVGNGWAECVHPEDLKRCLATYTESFDRRETFRMEYRLRRRDGEYRWVLDSGVPQFNLDRSFVGYIGSCVDVTDNKRAEESIASVNRRLIAAQEAERARIARELHDDINQRLALLVVQIEQYSEDGTGSAGETLRPAHLSRRIGEISDDIQAIAHDLHSSKMEHLGVLVAMRSFCADFARQQGLKVDFEIDNAPLRLPHEVSLALFRILQESLHNALHHSQGRHFKVELGATSDDVYLRVRDWGVGFDLESEESHKGLGLVSMRERVRFINGTIEIESKPMNGTTVLVRVPLSEDDTGGQEQTSRERVS